MVKWDVSNIVATIYFNVRLPLDKIANSIPYASYDPETFPGLILPLKDGKIKALIFNSGTINFAGLKKIDELEEVIEVLRKIFADVGINLPQEYKIKLQNIVVNGEFDYDNIDIVKLSDEVESSLYNPEAFPAVIVPYKISQDYEVKFNVFKNGKFVCAGLKGVGRSIKEIYESINKVILDFQEKVISKYAKK
ncbi:MAG: TATA-box-binding protein [Nanopusillaceae archaeon]|jgi:transcription initiation factor TFIID TATA-box-binding protein